MLDPSSSYTTGMAVMEKIRKARIDREQERSFLKIFVPLEQSQEVCPFSVQILRAEEVSKQMIRGRYQFEIETCNQITGKVYNATRSYQEFKLLREALLAERADCPDCSAMLQTYKEFKVCSQSVLGIKSQRSISSQTMELTHFLQESLKVTVNHFKFCLKKPPETGTALTSFLDISPALLQNPFLDDSDMFLPYRKTRKDRISIRKSLRRDDCQNGSARSRQRGYSDPAGA